MLINKLKQEESPGARLRVKFRRLLTRNSDGSQLDDDDNDEFLEELERENLMLEKELENLMQLKSSQQKETQNSVPYSKELSPTSEKGNLEKIEENIEEERESYYYSNSEDEQSGDYNC